MYVHVRRSEVYLQMVFLSHSVLLFEADPFTGSRAYHVDETVWPGSP